MNDEEEYPDLEALLQDEEEVLEKKLLTAIYGDDEEEDDENEDDVSGATGPSGPTGPQGSTGATGPVGSTYIPTTDDEIAAVTASKEAIKNANVQKVAANLDSDLASSNPIEGWLGLINTPVQPLELTEIPEGFSHQTLVIIEVSAMSPSTFMERMRRFVGGLNTPDTMKANVVTVTDGKMYAGLTFTGDKAGGREVPFNKNLWNAVIRVSEKDIV